MSFLANVKAQAKDKIVYFVALYRNKRVVKIFTIVLSIKLVIFLALFGLTQFIDPSRYKEPIEKFILERTGQMVILQGPLRIHLLPYPVLEAEEVILKEQSLTAKTLKIYPDIRSFFSEKKYFELALSGVTYNPYHISELYTYITFENGIIELEETKCDLAKGKHQGTIEIDNLRIDITGNLPKFYLKHDGDNFPLAFVMSLAGHDQNILIGHKTRLMVDLTAEGQDIKPIKKSLNGHIEIEISKGKFQGTDLIGSLKKAKSFVGTITTKLTQPLVSALQTLTRRQKTSISEETPFDTLKMIAKLNNGILDNHHLKISHAHYEVVGRGNINLNKSLVNYRVEAIYKGEVAIKRSSAVNNALRAAPLVIFISGPFEKPDIETDFDSYLKFVNKSVAASHTKESKSKKRDLFNFKKNVSGLMGSIKKSHQTKKDR
jgi:hypothetical protein